MKNKVQLITYIDRLGCKNISDLIDLFQHQFKGLFGGLHILPFYYPIDGEDAGFDPIDHQTIDPRLGDWKALKDLSQKVDIMADLIVNHMSAQSKQFKDFIQNREDSPYASLFLNFDTVFPNGATEKDLLSIYRPRPGFPFTTFKLADGSSKMIWTTFTSNQVDIDVNSDKGIAYLEGILDIFQHAGISMIRLDAAGYAIKKQGTSCFMIDETFAFIAKLTEKAKSKGIEVLVEIHSFYKTQIEIAKKVDYVYDFALPVLVLDTLFNKDASNLKKWLSISPRNAITVLDTHDGIGIIDVASEHGIPGLIEDERLDKIVDQIHVNSKENSLKATGAAASNLDLYQVNCTYFDALGGDEKAYLIARAIQFFVPGIPQVYYVGLFAGENDMDLLSNTNVGRDINRHYYSKQEITATLEWPLIKKLKTLILLRNDHPAFNGDFNNLETTSDKIQIKWTNQDDWILLSVNLSVMEMEIIGSGIKVLRFWVLGFGFWVLGFKKITMANKSNTAPLSFIEKVGYGVGDMASNFYMGFFSIFLLYYYVDVWGITPTGAATMFLVTKILDAISDPMMGIIADRTETKWGKYRPYILWVAVPYAALGYLLFLGPDLSQPGKLVYAYVTYSLIMLGYTAINVPYSALLAVISPLSEERTKATQYRFIFASLGTLVVGATAKPLVDLFGSGNELLGFRLTIVLFAILTIILFLFTFASTKERIKAKKHETSIKEDVDVLRKNTSWIILAVCSILIVVGLIARISSTAFFTKYNMEYGDEKVLWWMDHTTLIITSGFIGQLLGALITPTLLKFFDKRRLMIFMNLVFAGSIFATYFIPKDQFVLTLLFYAIGIFSFGIIITLLFSMYTDCSEYGEWMSGHNSAGLTVSASMFSLKFGSAVGSAIPGYILGWYGFVKDQEQTASVLEGINISWNIVPGIFFLIAAALMLFYKLDGETMKKVELQLLERRG